MCFSLSQLKDHLKSLLVNNHINEWADSDIELVIENFKSIFIKDINMLVELYKSEPLVPKEFKILDNG